jgi:pilus assembly protein CpaC
LAIWSLVLIWNLVLGAWNLSYTADDAGEILKLYLGEIKVISVNNPTRIAIGNPNVADVTSVTKSEITIAPKAPGKTTLVFWDNFGEQSYQIRVFSDDVNDLKRRIDKQLARLGLPEVYTQAEEEEEKVILLGRVKTAADKEKIALTLGPLKDKTLDLIEVKEEETIIDIDVQVLELDRGATETLGITWPSGLDTAGSGITVTEVPAHGAATAAAHFGKLLNINQFYRTAFSFNWKLDLLIQEGKARILSRPRLACQSGKEAKLVVGGEVPVFTATQTAVGTTGEVDYKEYGIILNIKPIVDDVERIHVDLGVEVSEIGTPETTTYAKAYPLTKRTASTQLILDDGQTMAIGGLVKQKSEEDLRKFPWLADVPVLGLFFRQRITKSGSGYGTKGDTELFITLTPKLIREKKAAAKSQKTEIKPTVNALPVAAVSLPEGVAGYASIIQGRILENLNYPLAAKEASFQGTVTLGLRLNFRGELLEAKVKSSSGYDLLDASALGAAQNIGTYPPFPASIKEKELWIDVPVQYRLD